MQTLMGYIGNWASVIRNVVWMYQNTSWSVFRRLISEHFIAWRLARQRLHEYNLLDDDELKRRKTSDRVFVFGSGASLNAIGDNGTYYLHKTPITYFVLRAGMESVEGNLAWRGDVDEIVSSIDGNRFLDKTVFHFQKGFTSIFCNRVLGFGFWKKERPLRLFFSDKVSRYPFMNSSNFLVHRAGTLCTAVSLAVSLGYKEIVLTGVDLYDNRYFWLPPDLTMGWDAQAQKWAPADKNFHGSSSAERHNTVRNGVVDILGDWQAHLAPAGIKLYAYNPRSLLTEKLPVFKWNTEA